MTGGMTDPFGAWEELGRSAPSEIVVDGVAVRRGSRVRLRPRPTADVFDLALAGREGVVASIEQDMEARSHSASVRNRDGSKYDSFSKVDRS